MKKLIFILLVISLVSCRKEDPINTPKLIKILNYTSFDKSFPRGITEFEYDQYGNNIKETFYYNNTIKPLFYFISTYKSRIKIKKEVYNAMGTDYGLAQTIIFHYQNNNLTKEETHSSYSDSVGHYTEYKYDNHNNLIEVKKVQDSSPYIDKTTKYIYDSNNLKTKTIVYLENSNDINTYTEHYYSDNLLTYEKVFNSTDELIKEYNYKYDSDNNIIEKTETRAEITKVMEISTYKNSLLSEKIYYRWGYHWGSLEPYELDQIVVYEYDVK